MVPAYYEMSLKEKYTRSEENKAVIDIINSAIMMDCTFAFASTINSSINQMLYKATVGGQPAASLFESLGVAIDTGIQKLLDTYAALE